MKKFLIPFCLFMLLGILLIGCTKKNLETPTADKQIQEKIQASVDQIMAQYKTKYPGFPGGIALQMVTKSGAYFVASGMEAGITDQVHFRAASNTKTFTSTAILLLAQEGKLQIDAKIIDTIPGTKMTYVPLNPQYNIPYRNQITIRDLLQHNAGVYDISNDSIPITVTADVPYVGQNYLSFIGETDPNHSFTFDELVGVVATCQISYAAPRVKHKYSNTGYSILGKIIERVSGMSYGQFITDRIFKPMGMTQSSMPFTGSDQLIPAPFARGYYYLPATKECTQSNISANVAEGNLITTPYDLSRFIRKLLRGEGVLTITTVNTILKNIPAGPLGDSRYACGISFIPNLGWGHNGAHEGFLSRMVTDPDTDITLIAFTNTWNLTGGMGTIVEQLNNVLDEACLKAKALAQ